MEVHPPDHPVMTWRQFFVHMAIVVLGLLIAIGLEQSVETWRHHRERRELEEALRQDLEQIQSDALITHESLLAEVNYMAAVVRAVEPAIEAHNSWAPPPDISSHIKGVMALNDPAFRAARSNGTLTLLPPDEVRAFSEMDSIVEASVRSIHDSDAALAAVAGYILRFGIPGTPGDHWAHASPEDYSRFLEAEGIATNLTAEASHTARQAYNCAHVLLAGERNLAKIYAAEEQPIPTH